MRQGSGCFLDGLAIKSLCMQYALGGFECERSGHIHVLPHALEMDTLRFELRAFLHAKRM